MLSRLFRRRFLEELQQAHRGGRLQFFGDDAGLADGQAFAQWLGRYVRASGWSMPSAPLPARRRCSPTYPATRTGSAISNSRLLAFDECGVTVRYKDYRAKGKTRYKAMTLTADEFMRRFLLHVLPSGFHRIRHYGLLANAGRRQHLAQARELLQASPAIEAASSQRAAAAPTFVCPHCGAAMRIMEVFARGPSIRAPPLRAAA